MLLIAIFSLGRLHETLSPHAYLWVLTVLAGMCAALATRRGDPGAEVERYIAGRESR